MSGLLNSSFACGAAVTVDLLVWKRMKFSEKAVAVDDGPIGQIT